jgi:hypothetical protein
MFYITPQASLFRNKFCLSVLENTSEIILGEVNVYCALLKLQQFLAAKQ